MFSGGESSEGMNTLNQLGSFGFVNQAAVTNALAAGQNIDWAQLAQQWIQMRDNPETEIKEAPPPPTISFIKTSDESSTKVAKFEEKGEADMDMDDEDQTEERGFVKHDNKMSTATVLQHRNINQPWFMDQASSTSANIGSQLEPRLSSSNQWNPWPNQEASPQTNTMPSITTSRPTNPTAHIPSLLKITVPHPNEIRAMPDIPNQQDSSATIMDAAKRKGLPAWIREGLEKMEREKQKQMERQQVNDNIYSSEDDASPVVKSPKSIMVKSLLTKNDACVNYNDDEDDDEEEVTDNEATTTSEIMSSRNVEASLDYDEDSSHTLEKSYEQKLSDMMIVVRRTLTELLLEVTNDEIAKVADETIKSFKTKASSAQVIRKSALSTITGKLGLAAYADSSSEEDSDDDDDDSSKKQYQSESDNNSEDEIKNIIRSKRRAFVKISEDIEEKAATAAAREEEKLKYFLRKEEEEEREYRRKKQDRSQSRDHPSSASGYSGGQSIGKGYDREFGETTETKLQHLNGKRQKDRSARKERTTRFSDNKDKKYVALAATAAFITNMNATGTNATSTPSTPAMLPSNIPQHQPDFNGLLQDYRNVGVTNALNAADAALEKALKRKSSQSPDKYNSSRRRNRDSSSYTSSSKKRQRSRDSRSRSESTSSSSTSSSSTSSSDSDSTTSRSSHNSKDTKRSTTSATTTANKSHRSSSKKSEKSPREYYDKRRDDDKHKYSSSSSSYAKRDRESSSSNHYRRRRTSSDSDDYYNRRKYDSHYSRNSSSSHSRRTHTSSSSSRRDRDRSRSRSRSAYSSSSRRH